jgi:Type II intron maturase
MPILARHTYGATPSLIIIAIHRTFVGGTNQTIARGSFGGLFTVAPTNDSSTITDSDIQSDLSHMLQLGELPLPQLGTTGSNTLYALAHNRHILSQLRWIMVQSLTKMLAHKLRITVSQVYDRFQDTIVTANGPRRGLTVRVVRGEANKPLVAECRGITLARRYQVTTLNDQPQRVWNDRTEVVSG